MMMESAQGNSGDSRNTAASHIVFCNVWGMGVARIASNLGTSGGPSLCVPAGQGRKSRWTGSSRGLSKEGLPKQALLLTPPF